MILFLCLVEDGVDPVFYLVGGIDPKWNELYFDIVSHPSYGTYIQHLLPHLPSRSSLPSRENCRVPLVKFIDPVESQLNPLQSKHHSLLSPSSNAQSITVEAPLISCEPI